MIFVGGQEKTHTRTHKQNVYFYGTRISKINYTWGTYKMRDKQLFGFNKAFYSVHKWRIDVKQRNKDDEEEEKKMSNKHSLARSQ